MTSLREELRLRVEALRAEGLERRLERPEGADFSSNDYLGLSRHPALRAATIEALEADQPLSAPASRLLRGHRPEHEEAEAALAGFKGAEAALLFPSGWQANQALLTTLVGPEDRVISDELNHASIIDGLRLSGARKVIIPHLDVHRVEEELSRPWTVGRTFVVTESLFSMDGDVAPLDAYAELTERHGASLVVDDAHATGVWGERRGSGLIERFGVEARVAASVSTFGKALGLCGACVAAPREVVAWLVQRARPFIYSTAVLPLVLPALLAALRIVRDEPERRRRLLERADRLRSLLRSEGLDVRGTEGPIVPVVLGPSERAVRVARGLRRRGLDVRAIRPPTVPDGSARLRVSVHCDHREEEIDSLARAIAEETGR